MVILRRPRRVVIVLPLRLITATHTVSALPLWSVPLVAARGEPANWVHSEAILLVIS